jgi:hypothetical protein
MIETAVGSIIVGLIVGLTVHWANRSAHDDKETRKENVNLKYAAIAQTMVNMEGRLNERLSRLEIHMQRVESGLEGVRKSQAKAVLKMADVVTTVAVMGAEVQNLRHVIKLISRRADLPDDGDEHFGTVIRKDK